MEFSLTTLKPGEGGVFWLEMDIGPIIMSLIVASYERGLAARIIL